LGFNDGGEDLVKIGSLNGEGKMSKSQHESATLYLADSDAQIIKKIKKAKTDAGPQAPNTPKPEYIENLFTLLSIVSTQETVDQFEESYQNCEIRYGDLKKQLGADMVKFVAPIRDRAEEILQDEAYLDKVIRQGSEKARQSASQTVKETKKL